MAVAVIDDIWLGTSIGEIHGYINGDKGHLCIAAAGKQARGTGCRAGA